MTFNSKRPLVASGQPSTAGVPSEDGRAGSKIRLAEPGWRAGGREVGWVNASCNARGGASSLLRVALPIWTER